MAETSPVLNDRTVIKSDANPFWLDLAEVWSYRELFYFLVWRDIKVRYKQTILGIGWAVVPPIVTMLIFTIIFGQIAEVGSDGIPYPIFSFVALVPWTFFRNNLTVASTSIVNNSHMVTKIYFPRIILPSSAILSGLLDFAISFGLLILLTIGYLIYGSINPDSGIALSLSPNIIFLPFFMLMALAVSLGMGLLLATSNALFRDVRHGTPFLVQIWFWITPIGYPSSELSEFWRTIYAINPMATVVEGFRWAFFGTETLTLPMVIVSTIVTVIILLSGIIYFQKIEDQFADVV